MQHFVSYRFVISNFAPCILIHTTKVFFIAIYVDDIILSGPGGPIMNNIKNTLKSKLEITDLGYFHRLLGTQIKFRPKGIELSQTAYINCILSQFGLQDWNTTILPIDRATILTQSIPEDVLNDIKTYQLMIGSIIYLVTCTRFNLTLAISFLEQFLSASQKQYVAAVTLSLRYIKGTWDLTLLFPYGCEIFIAGFSDSDYSTCIDSR
jgi:hypothetical protein